MSDIAERVEDRDRHLGVGEAKVTDTSFIDDLGADSLDTVGLMMAFERRVRLRIPTIPPKIRPKDAIEYIKSKAAEIALSVRILCGSAWSARSSRIPEMAG
jgi:acyl carrier protein